MPGLLGKDELKALLVEGWKRSEKVKEIEVIDLE